MIVKIILLANVMFECSVGLWLLAVTVFIVTLEVCRMKLGVLLMVFQATLTSYLVDSLHGDHDCQFTYDASSLEDDSDYPLGGSGANYDIGGNIVCNFANTVYTVSV